MPENPLLQLKAQGQSVWLDNLTRGLVRSGALAKLVKEDGLCGLTSNPAIFKNAITGSEDYDGQIRELAAVSTRPVDIFEGLAIDDIRGAADVLRPVFDASNGTDGFVSLEVAPGLARDARGTVEEAVRLWETVARENVLIKIPGTAECIPAIEEVLARGISVNVTLLFSLDAYRQVMDAHLRALETRLERGLPLAPVASVASFFLSRIDVMVDKKLDALAAAGTHVEEARALRGRAAVASAKLAYALWKTVYSGPRWEKLQAAGARFQKPLWASTSTKDPSYPDVKYVEALIGPHTINTMPDETVDAFRDHGKVAVTVESNLEDERMVLERLAALGIDIDQVTDALVVEGIDKFVKPFDALLASLEEKRNLLAAN